MANELPRIQHVVVEGPSSLRVRWQGKRAAEPVNLAGWIATGGDVLAPLKDPSLFKHARIGSYGRAVEWDDDDLSIDAFHLKMLVQEQRPFGKDDLRKWQETMKVSNAEAAQLVGVSSSTWATYRAGATIPQAIGMLLRVILRDPLPLQAHLRPRTAGRPRKPATA